MVTGKGRQGCLKISLWGVGGVITIVTLGFGVVIGAPLMIGAWIWAIVTATGGPNQTINVHVSNDAGSDQ